jgi:hypothetical protein
VRLHLGSMFGFTPARVASMYIAIAATNAGNWWSAMHMWVVCCMYYILLVLEPT